MVVKAVKTRKVVAGEGDLYALLDEYLPKIKDRSVVAITSKIVAICEGRVMPRDQITKDELIAAESEFYLPGGIGKMRHHFTITNNIIVASAGVDESNGDGNYVLWPKNPQRAANDIRSYLARRHGLKHVGVILTDSVIRMLRRGTTGIALSHSGFLAVRNYIGQPDLFGRPFAVTWANIADGLAASAVLVMGEGAEQTPLTVIEDVDFVKFQSRNPSSAELADLQISREEDLFAPFMDNLNWRRGRQGK